jgi:hypothetical protein
MVQRRDIRSHESRFVIFAGFALKILSGRGTQHSLAVERGTLNAKIAKGAKRPLTVKASILRPYF